MIEYKPVMRKREKIMKKKITIAIAVLTFVAMFFASCGNAVIKVSDENVNILDVVTTKYDDATLDEIVSFTGTMNQLNEKYAVEFCKIYGDFNRVAYLGDGRICFICFDKDGAEQFSSCYSFTNTNSYYDDLKIGDSLDDVMKMDPDADYLFLYSGVGAPRVSCHYTIDGYVVSISYDSNNIITDITIELI